MDAVIFDIDGTLADHRHRLQYVEKDGKKDWKSFFSEQKDDIPYPHTVLLANLLSKFSAIILITARPECERQTTVEWLTSYKVKYDMLLMRPNDNRLPSVNVKHDLYVKNVQNNFNVLMAFEDDLKVAEMWKTLSVPVLLCGDDWLDLMYKSK